MARDITDRVNAQSELRAERDFVSAILDTAPSLIMVLDAQGQIVRFNRACEELSGVSMSDVAGQLVLGSAVHPRQRSRRDSRRHSALAASREPVKLDRIWVGKSGARHVIAWTVMALRGQNGQTSYLIGLGADVTLARELERLKSQFISMVSHELRTPLTSIRASMQLLIAEDMTGNEDADQLVRVALSNADRLIRIVNDILDMSKIEAGEMMVSPKRTPLLPIVEDSVRSVEGFAKDSGVTITHSTNGIHDVIADPDRTIQVLVNLLSNAVKHAPSGSKVEVTAGRKATWRPSPSAITAPAFPPTRSISSSSRSRSSMAATRAASPYRSWTDDRARAREKQGGTIRVSSREGQGATFTSDDADCVGLTAACGLAEVANE
jgi:PAS domain S-box-containing protein